ncbi:GNAT family N-acetyltransferase [Aquiflexum gelatinilyticum]|uniref:GNAT family N-acetyltransferase n=1 Tax=Aquiflexum gelatinilyticum TaxID=2961943 RepID=UPI002169AF75|nr:GNAT family N-acetyltransferase [Aquiflexum gelatinilyticum]MCS4434266.1 GNAT family N-acetyltransferase [Aquiflexum gelatinilyticum]
MTIKEVSIDQILPIRQQVMWPDKHIDFVRVPEDENGIHFGLFVKENLVSVVSVFIHGQEAQFRKFATLEQFQGKGYGSKLLQYIFDFLEEKSISRIWCNARISKAGFYQKFGMTTTAATFEKEGMEYVVMEKI